MLAAQQGFSFLEICLLKPPNKIPKQSMIWQSHKTSGKSSANWKAARQKFSFRQKIFPKK